MNIDALSQPLYLAYLLALFTIGTALFVAWSYWLYDDVTTECHTCGCSHLGTMRSGKRWYLTHECNS